MRTIRFTSWRTVAKMLGLFFGIELCVWIPVLMFVFYYGG